MRKLYVVEKFVNVQASVSQTVVLAPLRSVEIIRCAINDVGTLFC